MVDLIYENPRPRFLWSKLADCRLWGVISAGPRRYPAGARTIMGVATSHRHP
jgi:hypothetical protein